MEKILFILRIGILQVMVYIATIKYFINCKQKGARKTWII